MRHWSIPCLTCCILSGCGGDARPPEPASLPTPVEPAVPRPPVEPAAPAPLAAYPDIAFPEPPWTPEPGRPQDRIVMAGFRTLDVRFTGGTADAFALAGMQTGLGWRPSLGWRVLEQDAARARLARHREVLVITVAATTARFHLEPLP
jgi:hypothetical protein